ncbi:hypothetical protein BDV96DRAFT_604086 [Lophiotrema nucula]|uniref:RING-type domain-containing protein n=1 Tax=Lophiotrema nucula TaxID=690887 RepID=A0A6A5YU43_9PLEO|nr:hypothetical protein BDV96DRAFT_604086 [Lophiotrema nucula]
MVSSNQLNSLVDFFISYCVHIIDTTSIPNSQCPICLETLSEITGARVVQVNFPGCRHAFDSDCLSRYVLSDYNRYPCCRTVWFEKVDDLPRRRSHHRRSQSPAPLDPFIRVLRGGTLFPRDINPNGASLLAPSLEREIEMAGDLPRMRALSNESRAGPSRTWRSRRNTGSRAVTGASAQEHSFWRDYVATWRERQAGQRVLDVEPEPSLNSTVAPNRRSGTAIAESGTTHFPGFYENTVNEVAASLSNGQPEEQTSEDSIEGDYVPDFALRAAMATSTPEERVAFLRDIHNTFPLSNPLPTPLAHWREWRRQTRPIIASYPWASPELDLFDENVRASLGTESERRIMPRLKNPGWDSFFKYWRDWRQLRENGELEE